jgi:hypothetical protein
MASSTLQQEISRAKRIVTRLEEIEQIEQSGGSIPQTYTPAPLLLPGQRVYSNSPAPLKRSSLIVVLKINWANYSAKMSAPGTTTLLSTRMKPLLSRLRHDLEQQPHHLPPLASLTARFEPAIAHLDETPLERQRFATCETASTLTSYAAWSETKGAEIIRQNSAERVSKCLVQIIRKWRDEIMEAEEARVGELEETFLQAVMRRLGDLEGVEREVEEEEREEEEREEGRWAREIGCG